jgi:hypothetical protein
MLLEKSRTASLITTAITVALVASSAIVLLGGCTSPTQTPVDTSEIVLLTPEGGETFHVGDTLKVTWKLQGNGSKDIIAVDIELSPDNGKTWGLFLSVNAIYPDNAQWENFLWKIPGTFNFLGTMITLANNSQCLLRVEQYSTLNPNLISTTKTPFTILP